MKNTMMKSFTVGLILIAMALIPACRSSRKEEAGVAVGERRPLFSWSVRRGKRGPFPWPEARALSSAAPSPAAAPAPECGEPPVPALSASRPPPARASPAGARAQT